jgi:NAD(P)H-dependent flavin oxidoreductase YrpB (nitropropane dioxygenase family)
LGLNHPIVAAGLGGGLSRSELTIAVAGAGGLGRLGLMAAGQMRSELEAHRAATEHPVAVNLLLPFTRRAHWELAAGADAVVTSWGEPRRGADGVVWIHQCGSVNEARAAAAAGADGVIVQGVEAGGHVRGTTPGLELLAQVRAALSSPRVPVWFPGGVAERADVETALAAGATAVVAGTRFLLSDESAAHAEYKRRLLDAEETVLTELFGAGWPAPHRVVRNAATDRWLGADDRGPGWVRAVHRVTAPALSRIPIPAIEIAARVQRPGAPLLSPAAPTIDSPPSLTDSGPLYAGVCVSRINEVRPPAQIVGELAGISPADGSI